MRCQRAVGIAFTCATRGHAETSAANCSSIPFFNTVIVTVMQIFANLHVCLHEVPPVMEVHVSARPTARQRRQRKQQKNAT
jgi:hypothetical protein